MIEDHKPYLHIKITFTNGTILNAKLIVDIGASHAVIGKQGSSSFRAWYKIYFYKPENRAKRLYKWRNQPNPVYRN